ncbi:MAG: oligoribonuclease [Bdellovibrionota bacterium]
MSTESYFFWIDLEMTGLDPVSDHILEVAVIITNQDFQTKDQFHAIVYQPQEILDQMNEWCVDTHTKSGLVDAIPNGQALQEVEQNLIEFCKPYFPKNNIILCGNSVHQDRKFIDVHMLEFAKRLHYRIIDISAFKEIFAVKYGKKFEKKEAHRAIDDIEESIAELNYYLSFVHVENTEEKKT